MTPEATDPPGDKLRSCSRTEALAGGATLDRMNSLLEPRVADVHARHSEWKSPGAGFLTPPIQRETDIGSYVRDAGGHLIEVGQTSRRPG